jgi:hypothetical protein
MSAYGKFDRAHPTSMRSSTARSLRRRELPPSRRQECCVGLPHALQRGNGRRRVGRCCRRRAPSEALASCSPRRRRGTGRGDGRCPAQKHAHAPSDRPPECRSGRVDGESMQILRATPAPVIVMSRSSTRRRARPPGSRRADAGRRRRVPRSARSSLLPPRDSKRSRARMRRRHFDRAVYGVPSVEAIVRDMRLLRATGKAARGREMRVSC